MKKKLLVFALIVFTLSCTISAFTEKEKGCGIILMGEVQSVEQDSSDGSLRILVKGYIKGCKVYKEEVLVIVNNDTMIIPNNCEQPNKKEKLVKYNTENIKVNKGDYVFVKLSEAMTKSIPPQSVAIKIQVSSLS